MLRADAKQYTSPGDFARRNRYFFRPLKESDIRSILIEKYSDGDDELVAISSAARRLDEVPATEWTTSNLKAKVDKIVSDYFEFAAATRIPEVKGIKDLNMATKAFLGWLRTAIMGGLSGPSMVDTMTLLQRDVSLRRLQDAEVLLKQIRSSKVEQPIP